MSGKTKCTNHPLVLRFISLLLVGFISLSITACGGSSGKSKSSSESKTSALNSAAEITDLQIAQSVYFDTRIPSDFYHEQYQNQDEAYYVTSHIKNTDLLAVADRVGVVAYELTSNNFAEAMSWSEQSESYQSSYKQLVDNSETVLYHQFTRMDPASPDFIYLQRILKASVLDRNGVDDDYKGRITISGMTSEDVKLIIEYLWTFTLSNNYGTAVLSSVITETNDGFIHTMRQAQLSMSFNESCDSIEVYEINYSVSKASGFIMKSETLEAVISARRTGDLVEICG